MSHPVLGEQGQPVAVWRDADASDHLCVGTMWGFVIHLKSQETAGQRSVQITWQDLTDAGGDERQSVNGSAEDQSKTWVLDRKPNQAIAQWRAAVDVKSPSSNAVQIDQLVAGVTIVQVDGVKIIDCVLSARDFTNWLDQHEQSKAKLTSANLLSLTGSQSDLGSIASVIKLLQPKQVLIAKSIATADAIEAAVGIRAKTTSMLPLAKGEGEPAKTKADWVVLEPTDFSLPSRELERLFTNKEKSCADSRAVFAALSIEQLNFKPANGTHTPRWNTEHMMGRELIFFSQIYHAVDPTIPVMNINPQQMPADYVFAHPDWNGQEEARQTKRVEIFSRRFAGLLAGLDLDEKAPGSRFWTPRGLLEQMERHYKEHTANVKKKMELPGWPQTSDGNSN